MFFSMIKRVDLNTEGISTGKSKLSETAKLVHSRILEIKKETIVLYFHYILLHLFGYLTFTPL